MAKIDKIQEVAVSKLVPYERNAKQHPAEQVELIARSIKEYGFLNPCLIDKDYKIIAGHGRVEAAKILGMETVPCVFVEGLTDAQYRAYVLADNRLTEMGEWDMSLVEEELRTLLSDGFDADILDMTDFGIDIGDFGEDDIRDIYQDEIPDAPKEPKSKRGEIYQLGNHYLMCGDSTSAEDVAILMNGEKADLVFTDPPWNVNYGSVDDDNPQGYKPRTILNDFMGTEEFKDFMSSAFSCMNQASKEGCMTYVVMSAQEWGNLMLTLAQNGYHWSSTIIWNKDRLVLSRKDYHTKYEPIWYGWKEGGPRLCPLEDRKQSDVWDFDRPSVSKEHPTMKPVELVAHALENSSHSGDIVLDLFGGSGTTLIAAEQLNRKCYMMELDPKYVDVIITRWENFSGQKAMKVR